MPKHRYIFLSDAQDAPVLAICPRCGGEVYCLDLVGEVDGVLLHMNCLNREEEPFSQIAPAASFFQEEL